MTYSIRNNELRTWLQRYQNFCSPDVQNKILKLFANDIVRSVCSEVTKQKTVMFAVIVDGTMQGHMDQTMKACIRYVLHYLFPQEWFLGFYETP